MQCMAYMNEVAWIEIIWYEWSNEILECLNDIDERMKWNEMNEWHEWMNEWNEWMTIVKWINDWTSEWN